jgi:hypothetical protein
MDKVRKPSDSEPDLTFCRITLRREIILKIILQRCGLSKQNGLIWFSLVSSDRLCGLVVRILGYRSGGPGSIPCTTRKKKAVGLERGPLSLVSKTEELLGRKSRGSCLENREYGRRDPSRWPRGILYPQKLAITSPTSGGCSVGIVRSRTQTMEFFYLVSSWGSLWRVNEHKVL